MADEIEKTAQHADLAVLRQVGVHELVANRHIAPDAQDGDLPGER